MLASQSRLHPAVSFIARFAIGTAVGFLACLLIDWSAVLGYVVDGQWKSLIFVMSIYGAICGFGYAFGAPLKKDEPKGAAEATESTKPKSP